jgi:hypothetical protein
MRTCRVRVAFACSAAAAAATTATTAAAAAAAAATAATASTSFGERGFLTVAGLVFTLVGHVVLVLVRARVFRPIAMLPA